MSRFPNRSFSQPTVPLSSSPSLTSPTFWRESRSTPRTSFDTNPASSSSRKFQSTSDPTPRSKPQQLRDGTGFAVDPMTSTATRFNSNRDIRETERATDNSGVSTLAVGAGLISGLGSQRGQPAIRTLDSQAFGGEEDNSPYSGPNIWPSAEGIHVRLDRSTSSQRTSLISQLLGSGSAERFQGLNEDGLERTSEWTLLKWEVLEVFLMDDRNTDHLDDDDILKRVGRWLKGQAALRSQKASMQAQSSQ